MRFQPWKFIQIFSKFHTQLKQEDENELPSYILGISAGTSFYENEIRKLWEEFKNNPTEDNARIFIDKMKELSSLYWPEFMKAVLNIENLTQEQIAILEKELQENQDFMEKSLLPDIVRGIQRGAEDFGHMDYRVIFLYSGALWSFGMLSTITFDGLQFRDLADIFIFAGPNDEETCEGERGCKQFAGKPYTVAQILAKQIIPGRLKCGKNCRHMLLPIASPL